MSTGETESTSAMLSNPKPTSSLGKSSAGLKSTRSRSRTVLLYSVRLSRRTVVRPGSGGALFAAEKTAFTDATNAARSAAVGCGLSSGGMSPASTIFSTSRHCLRARSSAPSSRTACSASPAFCFSFPWQETQCFSTNATPPGANDATSGPAHAAPPASTSHPRSAAARGRQKWRRMGIADRSGKVPPFATESNHLSARKRGYSRSHWRK